MTAYAVVTCESIISKLFHRLIAAHEYFPNMFNVGEIISN